jgi:hypothetical protein
MSQRSRARLNLALLLIVAALGALVWWLANRDTAPPSSTVGALDPGAVEEIVIERTDKPTIVLQRRGDGWWLTRPIEIAASSFRTNSILELGETESRARYDVADMDLARFGLDAPLLSVRMGGQQFDFGGTNPVNRFRYLRVGDEVHLILDPIFETLNAEVASFVGPRLLPAGARITRIELPEFSLSRNAEVGWDLSPGDPEVPADALQGLVGAWQAAEALWAKPYAGAEPEGRVRIELDDGRRLLFEIAQTTPDLVLARPDLGLEYTLDPGPNAAMLDLSAAAPQPGASEDSAAPAGD